MAYDLSPRQITRIVQSGWVAGDSDEVIEARLISKSMTVCGAAKAIALIRDGIAPIFVLEVMAAHENGVIQSSDEPRSVSEWRAELVGSDTILRQLAAYELRQSDDLAAIALLVEATEAAETEVQVLAIQSLAYRREESAVPTLCRILASSTVGLILSNTVAALEQIGDHRAIPSLIEATRHADPFVRFDAAWVLGELGDEQAVPALRALLEDQTKPQELDEHGRPIHSTSYSVGVQAKKALKKIHRLNRPWWRLW
jgi:hypothetical protein